jgi:hypothetical protein
MVVDVGARKRLWQNKSVRAAALLGDTVLAFTLVNETEVRRLAPGDGITERCPKLIKIVDH